MKLWCAMVELATPTNNSRVIYVQLQYMQTDQTTTVHQGGDKPTVILVPCLTSSQMSILTSHIFYQVTISNLL